MKQGVAYVAYGEKARDECRMSIACLRNHNPTLAVAIISDTRIEGAGFSTRQIPFDDPRSGARWAKLNLDTLSPFEQTVYLDADTRPRGSLAPLFCALDDGYELVIAPSVAQGCKALWHVDTEEREATLDTFGFTPIQLQAGVFAYRKCEAITALFQAWREEWERYQGQDQAALLRALYQVPVRVWLMSATMSEAIILHLFGKIRR